MHFNMHSPLASWISSVQSSSTDQGNGRSAMVTCRLHHAQGVFELGVLEVHEAIGAQAVKRILLVAVALVFAGDAVADRQHGVLLVRKPPHAAPLALARFCQASAAKNQC